MVNHETNELFFDNLEIPAENLIGEEGSGFKYILDGLNAERAPFALNASAMVTGLSTRQLPKRRIASYVAAR